MGKTPSGAPPDLRSIFDDVVAEVWGHLQTLIPAEFKGHINSIQFLIYDEPPPELIADLPPELAEFPDELCGLHVGTPITEASVMSPDINPIRVYLFRGALIDLVEDDPDDSVAALKEEIAITLLHEIGHSFGLDEGDLERLGYD